MQVVQWEFQEETYQAFEERERFGERTKRTLLGHKINATKDILLAAHTPYAWVGGARTQVGGIRVHHTAIVHERAQLPK